MLFAVNLSATHFCESQKASVGAFTDNGRSQLGSSFHSNESYHGKRSVDYILIETQADWLQNRRNAVRPETRNSPFWKANVKVAGVNKMTGLLSEGFAWGNLLACDFDNQAQSCNAVHWTKLRPANRRLVQSTYRLEKNDDLRSLPEYSDTTIFFSSDRTTQVT